jgi:hypothetical protein
VNKNIVPVGYKRCSCCHNELPTAQFSKDKSRKDGLNCQCKQCRKEYKNKYYKTHHQQNKDYYIANKMAIRNYQNEYNKNYRKTNKNYFKEYSLKYNFNLTLTERDLIFSQQGNCCALCGSLTPKSKRDWCVDHDHKIVDKRNSIRGILCLKCNMNIIGMVENFANEQGLEIDVAIAKIADYLNNQVSRTQNFLNNIPHKRD